MGINVVQAESKKEDKPTFDKFARDHEVGNIASTRDLHGLKTTSVSFSQMPMQQRTYAENCNIHVAATYHVERFSRIFMYGKKSGSTRRFKIYAPKTEAPGIKVTVSLPALMRSLHPLIAPFTRIRASWVDLRVNLVLLGVWSHAQDTVLTLPPNADTGFQVLRKRLVQQRGSNLLNAIDQPREPMLAYRYPS